MQTYIRKAKACELCKRWCKLRQGRADKFKRRCKARAIRDSRSSFVEKNCPESTPSHWVGYSSIVAKQVHVVAYCADERSISTVSVWVSLSTIFIGGTWLTSKEAPNILKAVPLQLSSPTGSSGEYWHHGYNINNLFLLFSLVRDPWSQLLLILKLHLHP